jgi:hypothetical protein
MEENSKSDDGSNWKRLSKPFKRTMKSRKKDTAKNGEDLAGVNKIFVLQCRAYLKDIPALATLSKAYILTEGHSHMVLFQFCSQ